MSYWNEAFKELSEIEDEFDLQDEEDLKKANDFLKGEVDNTDELEMIVDVDAETEDDLKNTYVGQLLLFCPVCHTLHYANKEDIIEDEENPEVVNVGEPCPHCKQENGYEIKGEIAEYNPEGEEPKEDNEGEEDDFEFDEFDMSTIEDNEDEETKERVNESFKLRKQLKEHFEEDDLSDLATLCGEPLPKRVRESKKANASKQSLKESKLTEEPVYGLEPKYDSRKSFYGKAQVDTGDNDDKKRLYSYDTLVAEIKDGKPVVYGTYSATTLRHIKEWLKQLGFKAETSKQIMNDYGVKNEACKENIDGNEKLSQEGEVANFLKKAYEGLSENPTGTYYFDLGLPSGLHVVVGEYDGDICTKIAFNCDDLQCDYDYDWEMPTYKDGEVAFVEDTLNANTDFVKEAEYLIGEANAMDKEIANGNLLAEGLYRYADNTKEVAKKLVAMAKKDGKKLTISDACEVVDQSYNDKADNVEDFYKHLQFDECNKKPKRPAIRETKEDQAVALVKKYYNNEFDLPTLHDKLSPLFKSQKDAVEWFADNDARIKNSDLNEAYVIYKENGKYKGTPKTNYDAQVKDANMIQDYAKFDNANDIIDYLVKYTPQKDRTQYTVVDESIGLKENAYDEYQEIIDRAKMSIDEGASSVEDAINDALDNYAYLAEFAILEELFRANDLYVDVTGRGDYESASTYVYEHIFDEVYNEIQDYFNEKSNNGEIEESLDKQPKVTKEQVLEHLSKRLKEDATKCETKECEDGECEDDEEFDESLFNSLVTRYCEKVYENISNFETTDVKRKDNTLIVEGVLNYKSGNKVSTSFAFREGKENKNTKKFLGLNETFTKDKKAFTMLVKQDGKKLLPESLAYKYNVNVNDTQKPIIGKVSTPKKN